MNTKYFNPKTINPRSIQERIIQPKLEVNPPNDKYEQEADKVADKVMRMSSNASESVQMSPKKYEENKIQMKSKEDEAISMKSEDDENKIQMSRSSSEGQNIPQVSSELTSQLNSTKGQGKTLPDNINREMGQNIGADFSNVRIHTNSNAIQMNKEIGAQAFTHGNDIYFNNGKYNPDSSSGKKLLAHELTHNLQQTKSHSSNPAIQRYEGYEHQAIGDRYLDELLTFLQTEEGETWAKSIGFDRDQLVDQIRKDPMQKGGKIKLEPRFDKETDKTERPELTTGEIMSLMGDFYGTVDELAKAPTQEIKGILKVMQEEKKGTVKDAPQQYESITGGRYIELAKKNDVHFAPKNRQEWRRLHEFAITEAQVAKKEQNESKYQQALLIDSASCHFLGDTFPAGHLFDVSEIIACITIHLKANPLFANNPEMQSYIGVVSIAGVLPQLVLKNIHDRFNREGFKISNKKGMKWQAIGEGSLEKSAETKHISSLAAFLSRQQVIAAFNGGNPNPDEVEALLPDDDSIMRATSQAIAYIPDAVAEVESLVYRNRSVAPSQFGKVLGTIIESNMATVGNPARERQILDSIDSANRTGQQGSVVPPSFTILSW